MSDIQKCKGEIHGRKCTLRDNCARFTMPVRPSQYWVMMPNAAVNGRCNIYQYNGEPINHES